MKTIKHLLTFILITVLFHIGCKKEELAVKDDVKEQAPVLTQKISSFIKSVMSDVNFRSNRENQFNIFNIIRTFNRILS
jgi:PBP1b-binding outer membrane lipoprotein LpoB